MGHDKIANVTDILACLECQTRLPAAAEKFVRKDELSVCQPLRGPLHITHAFNVMNFHHRDVSLANFALIRNFPPIYKHLQVPTVEVIGDTRHVAPLALQALFDARGFNNHHNKETKTCAKSFVGKNSVALISDAIAGFDTKIGTKLQYAGSRQAFVRSKDGKTKCVVDERGVLCGSCESLGDSFLRLVNDFEMSVQEASRLCSLNPARIARLSHLIGSLDVGKRGDLVFLDDNDDDSTTPSTTTTTTTTCKKKFKIVGCVVGGKLNASW